MARTPARSTARRPSAGGGALKASLAVDVVLIGVLETPDGPSLGVLEVRREGASGWQLPGVLVRPGEALVDAARRALAERAGVSGVVPRQLVALDPAERDGATSVAVVFVAGLSADAAPEPAPGTRTVAATSPGRLPYGQGEHVARAVEDLRARYAYAPDPDGLLGDTFTLRELRVVHETVVGYPLQRDTFRRAMEPHLRATGRVSVGGRGRPAELFRRS